ncbi:MAG: hypothetical protein HGA23_05570 [Bacteroidales bacterium]|nr:hypothetical protein [Bacteroidales bacterium]
MKKVVFVFIYIFLLLIPMIGWSQDIGNFVEDESDLYASTKQVNQFFRRFNGEENIQGERLYPEDKDYRDPELRKKYMGNLFNHENGFLDAGLKTEFINYILDNKDPVYLEFLGGDWFAEVTTTFTYQGNERFLTLFLQLEKDTVGSKWVINQVYFEPFAAVFANQDSLRKAGQKFLHPMSHELDFMNLVRSFESKSSLEHYLAWKYKPDYLTLFVYEFKKGNLAFKTINKVKFHFFQVDGWYFELSDFNRKGYNTGWLISALSKISKDEKDLLLKYIYHE